MKTTTSIISILFLALTIHAKEITKEVLVTEATIYLKGAKVTATCTLELPKGKNNVRLENLPRDMNPNSIGVSLPKSVSLMSVNPELQTVKPQSIQVADPALQLELNKNNRKIQLINMQIQMLNKEKQKKSIKNDKKIAKKLKKTKTSNLDQLNKLIQRYDNKMVDIERALALLNKQIAELQELNKAITDQLNHGKPVQNRALGYDILLELDNSTDQKIELVLTYLVDNAGWVPNYDIRALTDRKVVEVTYKGKIYQNTGQDWSNIKLSVSSFKPNLNTQRPILNPLYAVHQTPVQPIQPAFQNTDFITLSSGNLYQSTSITVRDNVYKPAELNPTLAEQTTWTVVTNSPLSVIFELNKNHTIPSSPIPRHVFLDSKEAPADYVYHAVPSLSSEVHLLAKVKDWNGLNLMGGEAFLFMGDNYVGKTVINSQYTTNELPIALGTDERVVVRRSRLHVPPGKKDKEGEQKDVYSYEITYKNNMNFDVVLEILDQIPLSLSNRIKILDVSYADAELNESSGALLWTKQLPAGKSGKLTFGFTMVHEKDMIVELKRGQ